MSTPSEDAHELAVHGLELVRIAHAAGKTRRVVVVVVADVNVESMDISLQANVSVDAARAVLAKAMALGTEGSTFVKVPQRKGEPS